MKRTQLCVVLMFGLSSCIPTTQSSTTSEPATWTLKLTPSTNQLTSAVPLTLTAETTADDGKIKKIEFYRGTQHIGTDRSAPYQMTAHLGFRDEGTVTFKAIAFDAQGRQKESTTQIEAHIPDTFKYLGTIDYHSMKTDVLSLNTAVGYFTKRTSESHLDEETSTRCSLGKPSSGTPDLSQDGVLAGDSLTFSDDQGSPLFSVPQKPSELFYMTMQMSGPTTLKNTLPETTTYVSFPGSAAGFPAFDRIPFPKAPPALDLKLPSGKTFNPLDSNTKITWTKTDEPTFYVRLEGKSVSTPEMDFSCLVKDTGEITFDSRFKQELQDKKIDRLILRTYGRIAMNIVQEGDAALILTNSRTTLAL